jgi:acylphosphatase
MNKRVKLIIKGKVQGVWYRASAKEQADILNLKGWVKNNIDGSVTVVAEGEENVLKSFIEWCWQGPPASKVSDIEVIWSAYSGEFNDFSIIY